MAVEQTTLWLDAVELRNGRVCVVKELRGQQSLAADYQNAIPSDTIMVQDCGVIVNNTVVAIVNPQTHQLCKPDEVGEIWVSSPGTIDGIAGPEYAETTHNSRPSGLFDCVIPGIDAGIEVFSKGLPYEMVLFTLGPFVDEIIVNGLIHYPEDVEATIERWHESSTVDGCMVFKSQNQVVAAIECLNLELAMNSAPQIVLAVLARHRFLLGTIVFLQPSLLAKSRHNEKQRGRVAAAYQNGKLPIMTVFHISQTADEKTSG
ncbi:hypothetical protein BASA62_009424 [Batrachochytrium salamandrivorans]|nr:hypothetical protein BASA62_009424 [Batrachochytrium salamandrivorans]